MQARNCDSSAAVGSTTFGALGAAGSGAGVGAVGSGLAGGGVLTGAGAQAANKETVSATMANRAFRITDKLAFGECA